MKNSVDKMEKHSAKILFVDEDKKYLRLVSQFLSSHGCAVTSSSSGIEARLLFEKHDYDALVFDADLNCLTELCTAAQNKHRVPIFIFEILPADADKRPLLRIDRGTIQVISKQKGAFELLRFLERKLDIRSDQNE